MTDATPTPARYAEDVILPASMDTCRLAFWLCITETQPNTASADDFIHRDYIREKAERLYSAKQWWHVRQMLHPALWSRFYFYITSMEPTPEVETAIDRIRAIDRGMLSESGRSPETP